MSVKLSLVSAPITQESGLFSVEETAYDEIAVLVEAAPGGGVDHP